MILLSRILIFFSLVKLGGLGYMGYAKLFDEEDSTIPWILIVVDAIMELICGSYILLYV